MPDITIITDASVDAPTGIAGWGMWAKGHGRSSITRSGVLRTRVRSSVEAEFLAVVNAIHVTLETYRMDGDVVALVQADNVVALSLAARVLPDATVLAPREGGDDVPIPPWRKPLPDHIVPAAMHLQVILERAEMRLELRHVRGHRRGGGRHYVNRLADTLAREAMRTARAQEASNG